MGLEIAELENKMMAEITRPERVLNFLVTGRLVCIESINGCYSILSYS